MNSDYHSMGVIEENSNDIPDRLDIPPFGSAASTADSFFDVYVEIDLPDQSEVLHNEVPIRWEAIIHHKPPAPCDTYHDPGITLLELFDEAGSQVDFYLGSSSFIPIPCAVEVDAFTDVFMELILTNPQGPETIVLTGEAKFHVFFDGPMEGTAYDDDGDGLDEVQTELVQLDLVGTSILGPVNLHLNPGMPSMGELEENTNNVPGVLDVAPFTSVGMIDSFFDVFVEIEVGPEPPMHNIDPLLFQGQWTHKPPDSGEPMITINYAELFDPGDNPTGFVIEFMLIDLHTNT